MVQSQLINRNDYNLDEREFHSKAIFQSIHRNEPHVLIATCNRTELYWGDGAIPEETIRHLFRVASGLESAMVGETAIQGQIKKGYYEAVQRGGLSASLNKLFQSAIAVGHRVRTETGISKGAVSHSQATVEILEQEIPDLHNSIVSIIGVNELTESILRYLSTREASNILLANRSFSKAETIAQKYGAYAMPLSEKKTLLELSDVVICATSAPHTILHTGDFNEEKKLLFDLAFPRDIDAAVAQLPNKKVYNLEEIEAFAQSNRQKRNEEIVKCEAIIEEEIAELQRWFSNREKYTLVTSL